MARLMYQGASKSETDIVSRTTGILSSYSLGIIDVPERIIWVVTPINLYRKFSDSETWTSVTCQRVYDKSVPQRNKNGAGGAVDFTAVSITYLIFTYINANLFVIHSFQLLPTNSRY